MLRIGTFPPSTILQHSARSLGVKAAVDDDADRGREDDMKWTTMAMLAGAMALGVTASAADRTRTRSGRTRSTTAEGGGVQVDRTRTARLADGSIHREGSGTITGPGGRTVDTRGTSNTTWDPANRTVVREGEGTATGPNGRTVGGSYTRTRQAQGNGTWTSNTQVRNQQGDPIANSAITGHASYDRSTHTLTVTRDGDVTGRNGKSAQVDQTYTATYDRATHSVDSTRATAVTGPNGKTYNTSSDRTATYGSGGRDTHTVYTGPRGNQATSDMHTTLSAQDGVLTRTTDGTVTGHGGRSANVDRQTDTSWKGGTVTKRTRVKVTPSPAP